MHFYFPPTKHVHIIKFGAVTISPHVKIRYCLFDRLLLIWQITLQITLHLFESFRIKL